MSVPALRDEAGASPERWRIVVALPPPAQRAAMAAWLDRHCDPGSWEAAPAGRAGVVNDALAFSFADRAAARAFIGRFCCGYRVWS